MKCPYHGILDASGLPVFSNDAALPERLRRRPRTADGNLPVPFFVPWVEGKPDFTHASGEAMDACLRDKLCWICGETLGKYQTFVTGPLSALTRAHSEPPCHRECAEYAVRACPYLLGKCERSTDMTNAPQGLIAHHPSIALTWTTTQWQARRIPNGVGFALGPATAVGFWKDGRAATRAETERAFADSVLAAKQMVSDEDWESGAAESITIALGQIHPFWPAE